MQLLPVTSPVCPGALSQSSGPALGTQIELEPGEGAPLLYCSQGHHPWGSILPVAELATLPSFSQPSHRVLFLWRLSLSIQRVDSPALPTSQVSAAVCWTQKSWVAWKRPEGIPGPGRFTALAPSRSQASVPSRRFRAAAHRPSHGWRKGLSAPTSLHPTRLSFPAQG